MFRATSLHIHIYEIYVVRIILYSFDSQNLFDRNPTKKPMHPLIYTAGARIIERSQEYKSTVNYRTFVLLRVPIPRGVGKFNYRTGPGKH